jgi:hypothetical protein
LYIGHRLFDSKKITRQKLLKNRGRVFDVIEREALSSEDRGNRREPSVLALFTAALITMALPAVAQFQVEQLMISNVRGESGKYRAVFSTGRTI